MSAGGGASNTSNAADTVVGGGSVSGHASATGTNSRGNSRPQSRVGDPNRRSRQLVSPGAILLRGDVDGFDSIFFLFFLLRFIEFHFIALYFMFFFSLFLFPFH
jgi:hypothetical protein